MNESTFIKQHISTQNINGITTITGTNKIEILSSDKLKCKLFLIEDIHAFTRNGFRSPFSFDDSLSNSELYLPLYLDALFKKHADKHFEVMIELFPSKLKNIKSVVGSITKQFDVCYQYDEGNLLECTKEWPNVRFHNIDIRTVNGEGTSNYIKLVHLLYSMEGFIFALLNDVKINNFDDNIKTNLKNMIQPIKDLCKKSNLGEYIINLANNDSKLNLREYKNTKANSFVKNSINFDTACVDINGIIKKLNNKIKNNNAINIHEFISLALKIQEFSKTLATIMVDYYTFITFIVALQRRNTENQITNFVIVGEYRHLNNMKNFVRMLDNNANWVRGSYELSDEYYNRFIDIITSTGYNKFKTNNRLGINQMIYVLRQVITNLISNGNTDLIVVINKLISELHTIRTNKLESTTRYYEHPENRIVRISSSVIENALGL